ncbi:MAG: hypothetical protein JWQ27_2711 [Ferruginibacter sp.]|nr:hypothetical protein [Ferruginibacter sp.]
MQSNPEYIRPLPDNLPALSEAAFQVIRLCLLHLRPLTGAEEDMLHRCAWRHLLQAARPFEAYRQLSLDLLCLEQYFSMELTVDMVSQYFMMPGTYPVPGLPPAKQQEFKALGDSILDILEEDESACFYWTKWHRDHGYEAGGKLLREYFQHIKKS